MLNQAFKPSRLMLPLGMAVCLSLFGDLTLYAVLTSRRAEVGLSLAAVGVMLGANRLIRIPGNPVAGVLFDRWGRRRLFILGMILGVLSTTSYALARGFWPFLAGRLAWGLAWTLINVGGRAMVLDISTDSNRGNLNGVYNSWFLLGLGLSPLVGGVLVDGIGFRSAMLACAGLTAIGLIIAVMALPETSPVAADNLRTNVRADPKGSRRLRERWRAGKQALFANPGLITVCLLYLIMLFAGEGVVLSTVSVLLQERFGAVVVVGAVTMGVASASGSLLAWRFLLSGALSPLMGHVSDSVFGRKQVIVGGLIVGILSFGLLTYATSLRAIVAGVTVGAISTAAIGATLAASLGDQTPDGKQGVVVGAYSTLGDIGSAAAPFLAFALQPVAPLRWMYLLCAGAFLAGLALVWGSRGGRSL